MLDHDTYFMQLALLEAQKGLGFTSPNPMVGALVVKNGQVISSGFHKRDGGPHAEVEALANLSATDTENATMYVTLEPCCHYGRTPPCTDAIIKAKIARVVVANTDPDSRVSQKGISLLSQAGIDVTVGVLKEACEKLNSVYLFNRIHKRPYVVLKTALTLDGKIATAANSSKWISNEKSREMAHMLRRRLRAIAVGKNTVCADKPKLNCRISGFEQKPVDKLVFTNRPQDIEAELAQLRDFPGRVFTLSTEVLENASTFYEFCNTNGIDSVLVEGGGQIIGTFLRKGIVDRAMLFYKPAFLGADGISIANFTGTTAIEALEEFAINSVKILDNNICLDLYKGQPLCLLD